MWIRSQDRKILTNESYFRIYKECKEYSVCSRVEALGTYSTEKKALKVMDMIEDTILKCEAMRTGYAEYDFGALADGAGNIPVDIKKNSDKEVDISDEDLKMLKDIATREYMLNYKHITPNVNIEFGDVRETADINKIKDALTKMMDQELSELYVVEEG